MKKLFLVLAALISFNSYAHGCGGQFDPISGTCTFVGADGKLVHYNAAPPQSAPKKTIQYVDVYVPSKYGAFAINKKTHAGWGVLNKNSLAEAKKEALRECKVQSNNGVSCKIAAWVRNGCIAASRGWDGKRWEGFYVGAERGKSEARALKKCKDDGLSNCEIILPEGCSMPDGF